MDTTTSIDALRTSRTCKKADQCPLRYCFFAHPSGPLCPLFPSPCTHYATCGSRHPPTSTPTSTPTPTSTSTDANTNSSPTKPKKPRCRDGNACATSSCPFFHDDGILCRFFPKCTAGDRCTFRHALPPPSQQPVLPVLVKQGSPSKTDVARPPTESSPPKQTKASSTPPKPSPGKPKPKGSPGKPTASTGKPGYHKSVQELVVTGLGRHDKVIKKAEDAFRESVAATSRRALGGVDAADELTRRALLAKLQELHDQRAVFVATMARVQQGSTTGTGKELAEKDRFNWTKREIFRLNARLPAFAKRLEIERHLSDPDSRFTVIHGQTGSGKSTQIPQYAADLPCFAGKRIICTQPRKLAATSVAARVAFEYSAGWDKAPVGGDVGFRVGGRFKVSGRSRIEYVTEAVLLDMIARARRGTAEGANPFDDIGCVIVDEAHERSITCDLIMGSLKENHAAWKHVEVAITSATIDLELFSGFFNNAPVVEIPGRMFPVDIQYIGSGPIDAATAPSTVAKCAMMIQQAFPDWREGDILCFLPGQDDVLRAKELFEGSLASLCKKSPASERAMLQRVQVHALFGKQDADEQALVFKKQPDSRKVIFSTDVAETSVTIDGVVFVVDSGLRKAMVFDPIRNMSSLKVHTISRSSALQRCGRAGRTQPGKCFRLYSQQDFEEMEIGNSAEIFQQPLTLALLTLRHAGIRPREFNWIQAPTPEAMERAEAELEYLGAVDASGALTPLGRLVAEVQVDPKIARMIERAAQQNMVQAGVDMAAVLSVANVAYYRGNKNDKASKEAADAKKDKLLLPESGDVVSLYRTYRAWLAELEGMDDVMQNDSPPTPPKPDSAADDNEIDDEDDDNDRGLMAMVAKNLMAFTMEARGGVSPAQRYADGDEDEDEDGTASTYSSVDADSDTMSVMAIEEEPSSSKS